MQYNETMAIINRAQTKLEMGVFDRKTAETVYQILDRVERERTITVSDKNVLENAVYPEAR